MGHLSPTQFGDYANPAWADDYNTRDGCTICGDSGHDTEFHVDDALGPRRADR